MKRLLALLLVSLFASACVGPRSKPVATPSTTATATTGGDVALADGLYAEISPPHGAIVCELYYQKIPLTVASFVGLAEGAPGPAPRKPFFTGLTFHRVVPGFVVQGGDPTGTGSGGPGYRFPDEFAAGLRHDGPGMLSMANSGPDTNGSQFFITLGAPRYLDFVHAIFGRVVRGLDVASQIRAGDIFSVKIIRRGRAAQRFRADEKTFNELLARAPRHRPPHLEDRTNLNTGSSAPPWQAKYLENRLANLARFTGRQIFVRFADTFEIDSPGQTPAQAVAELVARLHLPAGAIFAGYSLEHDQWFLVGGPAGLKLPELKPATPPRTAPTTPDAIARQKQTRIYKAAEDVVSSLIDQTDPK